MREPEQIASLLQSWDPARTLCVCDERGGSTPLSKLLVEGVPNSGVGVLVGPEGGFSAEEFAALESREFVRLVSLGENILRAETAALAALAVIACR